MDFAVDFAMDFAMDTTIHGLSFVELEQLDMSKKFTDLEKHCNRMSNAELDNFITHVKFTTCVFGEWNFITFLKGRGLSLQHFKKKEEGTNLKHENGERRLREIRRKKLSTIEETSDEEK